MELTFCWGKTETCQMVKEKFFRERGQKVMEGCCFR